MSIEGVFRVALIAAAGLGVVSASAQDSMSLQDALLLARKNNGTAKAAMLDVLAADSRVSQARSAFLPTLTPLWRYDDTRATGPSFSGAATSSGSTSQLGASWRLLDSGERSWALGSSRASAKAAELNALQTVRQILFTVHQQFFDALRAEELLGVADKQVERANKILEQTQAQVAVGDAPEKDIYQARADYLNAKVQALVAGNRRSTAQASLKATIGWDANKPLPILEAPAAPEAFPEVAELSTQVEQGIASRPDLKAERLGLQIQQSNLSRAVRESGVAWTLDATYNRTFAPDTAHNRALTFLVSLPLFDGGRSREAAREARLSLSASESALTQSERAAAAEIEAAHAEMRQNSDRVAAAASAREAALVNYNAAVEAQAAGAAGTNVVSVLTAQVSLVTAESNYVEALYDYLISDIRLRVATGQPIQGEPALVNGL